MNGVEGAEKATLNENWQKFGKFFRREGTTGFSGFSGFGRKDAAQEGVEKK